tara:strand:+ start:395 stop:1522 length:1128 start_codon:yes stop_codon:yes gene_type:complete
MSKPTLALIPSGQKATKVYSVLPSDGSGDFTFDRDTVATRVRKDGLIEEVAADIPRLDWLNSNCPSLLLEPSATQLAAFNTNIKSANSYTLTDGTLTENTETAPDGTLTASTFKATATNGQFQKVKTSTSGAEYTVSVYVKRKTGSGTVYLRAVENANTAVTITDQWTRVSATVTSTSTNIRYGLALGTSGDEVYVWGFQVELGASASSFIFNTTGSDVTRNADVCNNAGDANTFNDNEGVLYAEIAALSNDGTSRRISLSDGGSSDRLEIFYGTIANRIDYHIYSGSSFQASGFSLLSSATDFNKIAVKYKENDFALWVNGTEVSTNLSGSTPIGLNKLQLQDASGSNDFYGKVKDLRYYDTALTDAELTELTT